MPERHRRMAEWTPDRIVAWADKTGPNVAQLVAEIMSRRQHPEQGFRSCLGVMRLGEKYGAERLEAACRRAIRLNACSYKHIKSRLFVETSG